MGKQHKGRPVQRGEKSDFTLEEKLKRENKQLKRENAKLRKMIQRSDIDRLERLESVVKEQRTRDREIRKPESKKKEKWRCHGCGKGYMIPRINTYHRADGKVDYYYRICSNPACGHKTRTKRLTSEVDLSLLGEEDGD